MDDVTPEMKTLLDFIDGREPGMTLPGSWTGQYSLSGKMRNGGWII